MAILVTGATGYIGAYVAAGLLARDQSLHLLVRADSRGEAEDRLWQAWQPHMDSAQFGRALRRVRTFSGDLLKPSLGLTAEDRRALVQTTTSIVHVAAALNRRSERACMNVNVRGTLALIKLAREAHADHGLARFSHVSTVSVAGERLHAIVREDEAIDWNRRDYDPYSRTKKLAEHLVRDLLPDVSTLVFRPSIVLGDSRRAFTTQFSMVRAFAMLSAVPLLPFRPLDRLDVVPADWVADAIVELHLRPQPRHATYHLSAGRASPTYRAITDTLAAAADRKRPGYVPGLARPVGAVLGALSRWAPEALRRDARLLQVFWPYLHWDTVFDNSRAVAETGRVPAPFPSYCVALLDFARAHDFRFPFRERNQPAIADAQMAGPAIATPAAADPSPQESRS